MADITLVWDDQTLSADFALGAADIQTGDELQTSIIVSLFTDPGWWSNSYSDDPWGCRLLELRRAKRSNATLQAARDYCQQALQWLLDNQIASAVDVTTAWQGSTLQIGIRVTQASGTTLYSFVWGDV